jgi:hypothetical protein
VRFPAVLALVLAPVLVHLAIVATSHASLGVGGVLRFGFVTAAAVTHWAIYSGLFLTFALTLRPDRDALITAMARRLYGAIPDELARYTRRVTWAWSCFFVAQLTTSVVLFFFAPLVVWSFFVNILDLPLVAAMFLAEYLCRIRCLSDPPRHSLSDIIRMISDVRKSTEEPAGFF